MPELPEVEVVKESLSRTITGKKIKKVSIKNRNLRYKIKKGFETRLQSKSIKNVKRFSKYIILVLSDEKFCLIHLGMSGTIHLLRKNILNLTDNEIKSLEEGKFEDRKIDLEIEAVTLPGEEGEDDGGEDDMQLSPEPPPEDESPDEPEVELAGDTRNQSDLDLMIGDTDHIPIVSFSLNDENSPIRAQSTVDRFTSLISEGDIEDSEEFSVA